jgi:hypothetical protein
VAPAESVLDFLVRLFEIVNGARYKRRIFSERSLIQLLDYCELNLRNERVYFDQTVDVNAWLRGKCANELDRLRALDFIETSAEKSASLTEVMQIRKGPDENLLMRRHMAIGRYGFDGANTAKK